MSNKIIWILASFGFLAILVANVLGIYYLTQAGRTIKYVNSQISIDGSEDTSIDRIPCEFDFSVNGSNRSNLERSILYLQKAINLNYDDSRAYFLLGQAYCMRGQYEKAIDVINKYVHLHPKNPYGHLLLGFAYDALCQSRRENAVSNSSPSVIYSACHDARLQAEIIQHLENAGVTREQLIANANHALLQKKFVIANRWYSRAYVFGGILPQSSLFNWYVSSILSYQQLPEINDSDLLHGISVIQPEDQIDGKVLHWLRLHDPYWLEHYGEKLSTYPGSDPELGAMWWDGSATVFLNTTCSSTYEIRFRAYQYGDITPGEILISVDLNRVANFPISGEWWEYSAKVPLTKGTHLIGIDYSKDVGDVMIDWVRTSQSASCDIQ